MTNMVSLSEIVYEHKVTLDTSEERALKVHFPRKISKLVKVKELSNRSCGLRPSNDFFYDDFPIDSHEGLQNLNLMTQ